MKELLSSLYTDDLTMYVETRVVNQLELLLGTLYSIIEADNAPAEYVDKCVNLIGILHYESQLTSYIIQKNRFNTNRSTFIVDFPSLLGSNKYLNAMKQIYIDKTSQKKQLLSNLYERVHSFFELELISEFTSQHQTPLFNSEIFIIRLLFNELAQEKIDKKLSYINEKFGLLEREELQKPNISHIHKIFYNSFNSFNYFALILNRKRNITQIALALKNRFLPGVETNLIITFIVNLVLSLFNSDFVDKKVKQLLKGIIVTKTTYDSFSNEDISMLIQGVKEFGNSWENIQLNYFKNKERHHIARVYKNLEKELGKGFTINDYNKRALLVKLHSQFEKKKKYIKNLYKTRYRKTNGIMEEDYSFGTDDSDISGIETLSDIETDDEYQEKDIDEEINGAI